MVEGWPFLDSDGRGVHRSHLGEMRWSATAKRCGCWRCPGSAWHGCRGFRSGATSRPARSCPCLRISIRATRNRFTPSMSAKADISPARVRAFLDFLAANVRPASLISAHRICRPAPHGPAFFQRSVGATGTASRLGVPAPPADCFNECVVPSGAAQEMIHQRRAGRRDACRNRRRKVPLPRVCRAA